MKVMSYSEYVVARLLIRSLGMRNGLALYNRIATDTKPIRELPPGAIVVTTGAIKIPAFYDISHWKIVNDWNNIVPAPMLMGTKATQSNNYKDPTFIEYFTKFRDILHCARLAYHFFERTVDPVRQADWFIDYIQPHIVDTDILCLDFEQGGETASQLWAFLDRVSQRKPNNELMIYSRKNLMDPISMTAAEKEYFKKIWTWPAGYPTDHTIYDTTPPGYTPNPEKWHDPVGWQYTDSAHVQGIEGDTDANLMEPPLIEYCQAIITPPTNDVITSPFEGVLRTEGRRFNSDIYVTEINVSQVRFEVVHEEPFDNGLLLPSQACRSKAAQLAWNGDEWDKSIPLPAYPKNLAVHNGQVYVPRRSAEPSLNIRADKTAEIIHSNNSYHYNTTTGRRYLIENGSIKSYLDGPEDQYRERHPRGLTGLSSDKRKVIMVTVDGRTDISSGITLKESALILQEFGAYTAYDRGGGGDAVDVIEGVVQNVPCDVDSNGNPGIERAVPQAILVYAEKENTMPFRYTATARGNTTRIRPDHNTNNTAYNAGQPTYNAGTKFYGNDGDLFIATVRLSNSNGVYQNVGDQWLRVRQLNNAPPQLPNGQPITGETWVAIIHLGSRICDLVDAGGQPPEPTPPAGAPLQALFDTDDGKTWKATIFTEVIAGGTGVPTKEDD